MEFFKRLWDLLRGNADSALSSMEDPEMVLNLAIKDATAEVEAFRTQVSRALVDQKRMEAELQAAAGSVDEWVRRAEAAVAGGDDELAREALQRRRQEEEQARLKYGVLQKQAQTVAQLKDGLRAMHAKLEDAKRRRNLLVARSRGAQAKMTLASSLGAGGGALERFDEMEAKVESLELEASASIEMLSEFGQNASLEQRFKALPRRDASIEAALAEIKARGVLGEGTPTALLGAGLSTIPTPGGKGSDSSR